jgi:TonB family protein
VIHRILAAVVALLVIGNSLCLADVETFTGRAPGVIKWVPVDFPPQLRVYGWNGKGLFLLTVNARTGDVDEIKVLKSTGHVLFNELAAKAFFQWKFQPGSARQVQVPVEFYSRGYSRDLH